MSTKRSYFTLPPEQSFLHGVAEIVLQKHQAQPIGVDAPLVLLPNRRSCAAFEYAYYDVAGTQATLLPRIAPLGDLPTSLLIAHALSHDETCDVPKAMSDTERQLLLMLPWLALAKQQQKHAHQSWQALQELLMELINLYDLCEEHEVDALEWNEIIPPQLAGYAREQATLLGIIAEHWPAIQQEKGRVSTIERRNRILALATKLWAEYPPAYPIIAAGSTGTVPAAANLLRAIAELPNGQVILPGYDASLGAEEAVPSDHPQYTLRRFVQSDEVCGEATSASDPIRSVWNAEQKLQPLEHVHLLSCDDVMQECATSLLLIKDALKEQKTIAVVSPNKKALQRLSLYLSAEQIEHALSVECRFDESLEGMLWLAIAEYALDPDHAVKLLTWLRHPLVSFARSVEEHNANTDLLEEKILRGLPIAGGIDGVLREAEYKQLPTEYCQWLQRIGHAAEALTALFKNEANKPNEVSCAALLAAHKQCFQDALSESAEVKDTFVQWVDETQEHAESMGELDPQFYLHAMRSLLQNMSQSKALNVRRPVQLLTPMEARLLNFDRVLVLSLNEGDWPAREAQSLWLHDSMCEQMQLPTQTEMAGRMAHDIWMLLHQREVYLLRPEQEGGCPAIPSRFWSRIEMRMHQTEDAERAKQEQAEWRHWATLYMSQTDAKEIAVPTPNPPLEAIPRSLSITQYDLLQRDPYALYAKEILQLSPLDEIAHLPDMRLYGSLVHRVMEYVTRAVYEEQKPLSQERFDEAIAALFSRYRTMPVVQSVWKWRVEAIAPWLLEQLEKQAQHVDAMRPEEKVQCEENGMSLRGRVDRIDYASGSAMFFSDYKTGSIPTAKEWQLGYASQLPLAALAADVTHARDMYYWKVGTRREKCELLSLRSLNPEEEQWQERLGEYAQWWRDWNHYLQSGEAMFLAQPRPKYAPSYAQYAHLERCDEWAYLRENVA